VPAHRNTESVLFGALGVLGFSGTLPATRAAVGELGPVMIAPRAWVAALLVLASVALSRWSQVHPRPP